MQASFARPLSQSVPKAESPSRWRNSFLTIESSGCWLKKRRVREEYERGRIIVARPTLTRQGSREDGSGRFMSLARTPEPGDRSEGPAEEEASRYIHKI
jgi:hypothetical protein